MTSSSKLSLLKRSCAAAIAVAAFLPIFALAQAEGEITGAPVGTAPETVEAKLQVPIPGINLTPPSVADGKVTVPFLAEYLAGAYTFLIGVVSVFAAVMMVIGGFQYLTAGGSADRVGKGRKRIINALIGLVLAYGSYAILWSISPDLVKFKALQIDYATPVLLEFPVDPEEHPEETVGVDATTSTEPPEGADDNPTSFTCNPKARPNAVFTFTSLKPGEYRTHHMKVAEHIVAPLEEASKTLYGLTGTMLGGPYKLRGGGFRELGKRGDTRSSQVGKWVSDKGCTDDSAATKCNVCNPFGSRTNYAAGLDPNPLYCPHTTGAALDVYCESLVYKDRATGEKYVTGDKLFYAPCQLAFERAMKSAGFCRLRHETWHYEIPCFTSNCSQNWLEGEWKHKGADAVSYRDCKGLFQYTKTKGICFATDLEVVARCGTSSTDACAKKYGAKTSYSF